MYRRWRARVIACLLYTSDLVRRILQAAPRYLSENGVLVLEIGHERDFFEAAFPELSPVWLDTEEASDQLLLLTREQLTT